MKIIRSYNTRSKLTAYHKVYENAEEFEASEHKHKLKDREYAQIGDYVMTDNGYYLPITYRYESKLKSSSRPKKFVSLQMPRMEYKNTLYLDTMKFGNSNRKFLYSNDPQPQRKRKMLSANEVLFAQLIGKGISMVIAYKTVFKGARIKRQVWNGIKNILENKRFVEYLIEQEIKPMIKEDFDNAGITGKYAAKAIKAIVDNPDISPKDKLPYIQLIVNIQDDRENGKSTMQGKITKTTVEVHKSISDNLSQKYLQGTEYEVLKSEVSTS